MPIIALLTVLTACFFGGNAHGAEKSVNSAVESLPFIRLYTRNDDILHTTAESFIKIGQRLGLGSCVKAGASDVELHVLQYLSKPREACGDGWFSTYCRASWENCVSSPIGIICDINYLTRLEALSHIVLSVHRSDAGGHTSIPTDAMWRIARLSSLPERQFFDSPSLYRAIEREIHEIHKAFPWSLSRDNAWVDNILQTVARLGIVGSVMFHELSHIEQGECALGHEDLRYEEMRGVFESTFNRSLLKNEIRADLRAIDVGSAAFQIVEKRWSKNKPEYSRSSRRVYIRAILARLEYEAMVLHDPLQGKSLYSNEPSQRSKTWSYYYGAGRNYGVYSGVGHIPPELRPLANFGTIKNTLYMRKDDTNFAYSISERLRAFTSGLLWKRCKKECTPEGVTEAIDLMMFNKQPSWLEEMRR